MRLLLLTLGCSAILLVTIQPALAQQVTFQRRPAQVGDTSRQQLHCDLDLTLSIRQGGQIIQTQQQQLQRQQERDLEILKTASAGPHQARVTYQASTVTLGATADQPQVSSQPVEGKTYVITRLGDQLQVTYPDGSAPPEAEQLIVQENMETFGLPNPLAGYFDGRTLRVGQALQLPSELARELLGFATAGNTVSQFGLKLVDVRPAPPNGSSPLALFELTLKAEDPAQSGVSMTLTGRLALEVETCRAVEVSLSGPVVASEMHGPEAAQYELHSQGQIKVAVAASYPRRS